MKDAYSFDTGWEGLDQTYVRMYNAYRRIFERCGLVYRAVHADSGAIGGEGGSHEFMALSEIGEDTLAICSACDYAANLELAEVRAGAAEQAAATKLYTEQPAVEKFHTPELKTIDQLVVHLQIRPEHIIKTLIYEANGTAFAVLVRGDHEVNEHKVANTIGASSISLADVHSVQQIAGVENGFVGPVGLPLTVLVDAAVAAMDHGITGAGEKDYHLRGVVPGRDFDLTHTGDFRNALEGESCPQCGEGMLHFHKGIEVGHVFKLGTKYSEKLGATFVNDRGQSSPMIMGCYGIGISRLLAAVAEQNHDEQGLSWPAALAPYRVHILLMSVKDKEQSAVAEQLYEQLTRLGIETLIDDRDERAGVKFKDSGLIGIPVTLVVGKDAGAQRVEYLDRKEGTKEVISIAEAVLRIAAV